MSLSVPTATATDSGLAPKGGWEPRSAAAVGGHASGRAKRRLAQGPTCACANISNPMAICRVNECTYCTAAQAIAALRADQPIEYPKLQALAAFTRLMVESHGRPAPSDVQSFVAAGYCKKQVLEIILAMAVKTISNYSNHVFHTEVDSRFGRYVWQPQGR